MPTLTFPQEMLQVREIFQYYELKAWAVISVGTADILCYDFCANETLCG